MNTLKKSRRKKVSLTTSFILILGIYALLIGIRTLRESSLFLKRERINVVFYGRETSMLSLGIVDNIHYEIVPDTATHTTIPGGYGDYRIAALGRLAQLEGNPAILSRTFASLMSTHIDYYFLPRENTIYDWKGTGPQKAGIPKLTMMKVLFAHDFYTNATIFDRGYLFFLLLGKRKSDFIPLRARLSASEKEEVYSPLATAKKYAGFFYEGYLRKEGRSVTIEYGNYVAAKTLARVLDGEGIRVVDLVKSEKSDKNCVIVEGDRTISQTAHILSRMFGCSLTKAKVEGADILFQTGSIIDQKWK